MGIIETLNGSYGSSQGLHRLMHLFLFKNDFPLKVSHALTLEELKLLKCPYYPKQPTD